MKRVFRHELLSARTAMGVFYSAFSFIEPYDHWKTTKRQGPCDSDKFVGRVHHTPGRRPHRPFKNRPPRETPQSIGNLMAAEIFNAAQLKP